MHASPAPATGFWQLIRPLLRQHMWPLILAMALVCLTGTAVGIQNVFPKWLFSEVLEPKDLDLAERMTRLAWLLAGYLVLSVVTRMVAWHLGYRIFTAVRERVVFALRAQFFRHVNHLCLRFHGQHPSGELFSYLFGSPLANLVGFIQHVSMFVPQAIMTLIATMFMFWLWDWQIGLVLLVMALISVWTMNRSRKRQQAITKEFQQTEGDVSGYVSDLLRGSKAVKLYAMERHVVEEFSGHAQLIGRKSMERDLRSHIEFMKQEGIGYVTFSLLMAACAWRYLNGHIDLGTVTACLTSYAGLTGPLQSMFQAMTMYGQASAAAERLGAVLTTASSTPDPIGEERPVPRRAAIAFTGVVFAYEEQTVLSGLDLTIPYGQKIAVVGPSGAGKSTLTQLLLRLYDPQQGSVTIGGTDLRHLRGTELRRLFGVVPQDPFIFRTTLRENLVVANPEASEAAIRTACERANAWEFITRLPGGLDSRVGEGGATLSGGQRQRLAIARVLLADPDWFIFDEATSALDTVSERLIQQSIETSLGERTAIFIAHRLATVQHCDRILVLDQGRIAQDGGYAELAARDGLFRDLVRGQQLH